MNPEEIKRYFDNNPPPQEVDWKPWAKIKDSQLFLKSCYTGIRTYNGPLEMCPAWWHLKDFYLLIKRSAAQENTATTTPEAIEPQKMESQEASSQETQEA